MILLGAGRVGASLHERARERGVASSLITRDAGWQALDGAEGDPILACVRVDDLASAVKRVPAHRRADLVLVQNGIISERLRELRLTNNTQGLLYFAATGRPGPIVPGVASWFTGEHGRAVARWLTELGLLGRSTGWPQFVAQQCDKLLWLVTMGVICEAHRCTVGHAVTAHRATLEALVAELVVPCRIGLSVDLDASAITESIVVYSLTIADFNAGVKEWPWRHGWLRAQAARVGRTLDLHDALIVAAGKHDLLAD